MAADFFANMLSGEAAAQFHSEIGEYVGNSDALLGSLGVPTGELAPGDISAFEQTIEKAEKQLELKKNLNELSRKYYKTLGKIAEEENKCRQLGLDFSQKLLELRAEAAKAWATYEGEVQKLTQRTKNEINLIGYKTGKEVAHMRAVHPFALQKQDEIYAKKFALAQANHQSWVMRIRESISGAIAKIQGSQQGSQDKVFGIFDKKAG